MNAENLKYDFNDTDYSSFGLVEVAPPRGIRIRKVEKVNDSVGGGYLGLNIRLNI